MKPLGGQVAVNLHQWLDINEDADKQRLAKLSIMPDEIKRSYNDAIIGMMTLNKAAALLMRKYQGK